MLQSSSRKARACVTQCFLVDTIVSRVDLVANGFEVLSWIVSQSGVEIKSENAFRWKALFAFGLRAPMSFERSCLGRSHRQRFIAQFRQSGASAIRRQ